MPLIARALLGAATGIERELGEQGVELGVGPRPGLPPGEPEDDGEERGPAAGEREQGRLPVGRIVVEHRDQHRGADPERDPDERRTRPSRGWMSATSGVPAAPRRVPRRAPCGSPTGSRSRRRRRRSPSTPAARSRRACAGSSGCARPRGEPARVDALLLADHPRLERVRGEPGPAPPGRDLRRGGRSEVDGLVVGAGDRDRDHLRQAVGADPAEQGVGELARLAAQARGRLARRGALSRRGSATAAARAVAASPKTSGSPAHSAVGQREHPLDLDHDRHPLVVVDVQPALDHPCVLRAEEALPLGADRVEPPAVGLRVERGPALDEHVLPAVELGVLARVVGDRDLRVVADPDQLLRQPERAGERDRAALAVADPERRHRGDHDALGRRRVGERRRRGRCRGSRRSRRSTRPA